ncbi:MAG: hypothetical protein ACR2KG_02480 [Nocardioidaceae bacterium]
MSQPGGDVSAVVAGHAPAGPGSAVALVGGSGWTASPFVLVRSAGFPIDLLDGARATRTCTLLDEPEAAEAATRKAWDGELTTVVDRLRDLASEERVAEAIWLSSPSAAAGIRCPEPGQRLRSVDRKRMLRLMLYLQRFAGKCDTASFFGPTWWGRLGGAPGWLATDLPATFAITRRRVLWSHWAVAELADVITGELTAPAQAPYRSLPCGYAAGGQAWVADFAVSPPLIHGPLRLDPDEVRVLDQIDGSSAIDPDGLGVAARLHRRGLLSTGLAVPSGLADPMAALARQLETLPEPVSTRWRPRLSDLEGARALCESPEAAVRIGARRKLGSTFEQVTARRATRGGGHYADRAVIAEEAVRNWTRCDLGDELVATLDRLIVPAIRVLLGPEYTRRRCRSRILARWLRECFPGSHGVPVPLFLHAADTDPTLTSDLAAVEKEVDAQRLALAGWLAGDDPTRRRVHVPQTDLSARADATAGEPTVANLDLMVTEQAGATAGGVDVVLGELHAMQDLTIRGSPVVEHPDPENAAEASAAQYARILPDAIVAEPVLEHTDKTKVLIGHRLAQVEFSAGAPQGENLTLRAGDLRVHSSGERLELRAGPIGPIVLTRTPVWSPANRESPLDVLALPHTNRMQGQLLVWPSGTDHVPRICCAGVVLHRETWWLAPQPQWRKKSGYHLEAWRWLRRWRIEHRAPETLYVRAPGEPKPVYVDLANPILVDWLIRQLALATAPVPVSEMLPVRSSLWLHDNRGRYVSEFRLTCYLDGPVQSR